MRPNCSRSHIMDGERADSAILHANLDGCGFMLETSTQYGLLLKQYCWVDTSVESDHSKTTLFAGADSADTTSYNAAATAVF